MKDKKFRATYYHFATKSGDIITLSNGNAKLVPIANETAFIVYSNPARKTCPYATTMCAYKCYAAVEENLYSNAKISRQRNYLASLQDDFTETMVKAISNLMQRKAYKAAKRVLFRVHESGDFYSRAYYLKWLEIARICEKLFPKLIFCIYTKSIPFMVYSPNNFTRFTGKEKLLDELPKNFVINASVWADTNPVIKKIMFKLFRVYTAADRKTVDKLVKAGKMQECKCADCGKCLACYTVYVIGDPNIIDIIVEIHG